MEVNSNSQNNNEGFNSSTTNTNGFGQDAQLNRETVLDDTDDILAKLLKQNEELLMQNDTTTNTAPLTEEFSTMDKVSNTIEDAKPEPSIDILPIQEPEAYNPADYHEYKTTADTGNNQAPVTSRAQRTLDSVSAPSVENDFTEPDFDLSELDDDNKDDFLNDVIVEAKQYNIQQGERSDVDTNATILSELSNRGALNSSSIAQPSGDLVAQINSIVNDPGDDNPQPVVRSRAERAAALMAEIAKEKAQQAEHPVINEPEIVNEDVVEETKEEKIVEPSIQEAPVQEKVADAEPVSQDNDDFFASDEKEEKTVVEEPKVEVVKDNDDTAGGFAVVEDEEETSEAIQELTQKLERERIFRQEMLEETKQMKVQMNGYENELTTVTKNVSRSNRILNFVLVVLIIALVVALLFIAYFAFIDRGILKTAFVNSPAIESIVYSLWL